MVEWSLSILYTATPQPPTLWLSVIQGFFEEVRPKASFRTDTLERESESEREWKLVGTLTPSTLNVPLVPYNQIFPSTLGSINSVSQHTMLLFLLHLFLCDAYQFTQRCSWQSTITLTLPVAINRTLSLLSIWPSREGSVNLRLNLLHTHLPT